MPPRMLSRLSLSVAIGANVNGGKPAALILTEAPPFRFQKFDDNRFHTVVEGDTLWNLADRYFGSVSDRPAQLWWVIAHFQPEPIHDPTIKLEPGSVIVVPSVRTVREEILADKRRID